MKAAFGPSWKQVLCEGKLVEGIIDPGSPAVLIISTSALRSLELLRSVFFFFLFSLIRYDLNLAN
jgi:hypothetical protein